jgi:ketosteroid isomerase-like protein
MGGISESRLRRLADEADIAACLARYARGIDRLDRDLVLSVYHPDAVDDHGKFVGTPTEFVEWAFAMHRRQHHRHLHAILNHTCDVDGDTAHTEAYFLFLSMNRSGPSWSASAGRYIDRFECRDGRWAIAHRRCIRDWAPVEGVFDPDDPASLTASATSLSDDERAFMRSAPPSTRDSEDPSYRRPLIADLQRLAEFRALHGAARDQGSLR